MIDLPTYVPTDLDSEKTFEIREAQLLEGRTAKEAVVSSPLQSQRGGPSSSTAEQDVQRSVDINRRVAMQTLAPKQAEIASERTRLVEKKYGGGLTSEEEKRLLYLTWQLNRLDDAQFGPALDTWEALVSAEEDLAAVLQRTKQRNKAKRVPTKRVRF